MARGGSVRASKLTEEAVWAFVGAHGGPYPMGKMNNRNDRAAMNFQREFSNDTLWKAFTDVLAVYPDGTPRFTLYEWVRQLISWFQDVEQPGAFRYTCGLQLRRLQMMGSACHSKFEFVEHGESKRGKAKVAAGEGADLDRAFRDSLKKVV